MTYCIKTVKRGLTIAHKSIWDGTNDFLYRVRGMSDSECTKDE